MVPEPPNVQVGIKPVPEHTARVQVDGKFFRLAGRKFYPKGVAYGPFAPNSLGDPFKSPEETARDFQLIGALGANLVRVYDVPPAWMLELALRYRLRLFVDIPWNKRLCVLDSADYRAGVRQQVRDAVRACGGHPAVFAFSVGNEIPPEIVRWHGHAKIARFIGELVQVAKDEDPGCLCTYANFPSTEYLMPPGLDFLCFNVYLHERRAFENYLARLQVLAEDTPLLLGETGVDSVREGEATQAEILRWQIETAFRTGLAGVVVFSFTDEWYVGGEPVRDWGMGITTAERMPKPAFDVVRDGFARAPYFWPLRVPRVSVVIPAYNSARTLPACLQSVCQLNYPDYEVILVDDGSTDATPDLVRQFPQVRYIRRPTNAGLSAARNTGIAAATGEIVAFTDADCRVDEDWLFYLVSTLQTGGFAAVGGPNLFPPDDSPVAAAVMAAPGGPRHVLLTDREAEHVPGCNMAFYKWVFEQVGMFDPAFHRAGDDVDICWRLQKAGFTIGFSPGAVVWHYRRATLLAYLAQQFGYGRAESSLARKHPDRFGLLGGSVWRGRIYGGAPAFVRWPYLIYRGQFATAGFQMMYRSTGWELSSLVCALEYYVLVVLPLLILGVVFRGLLTLGVMAMLVPVVVAAGSAMAATVPRDKYRWWTRWLIGLLHFLGPLVRGWARFTGRIKPGPYEALEDSLDAVALRKSPLDLSVVAYWSIDPAFNRLDFLQTIMRELDSARCPYRLDSGWTGFDLELQCSFWTHIRLITVCETHPGNRRLLKCRFTPVWSPAAKLVFWATAALELMILGTLARSAPWAWTVLATLPAGAWLLRRNGRRLQSIMVVMLDRLATRSGLVRVDAPSTSARAQANA